MDTDMQQLSQLLEAGKLDPFTFVQVGGFDGITGDPIYNLVRHYNIPGIIAEPQPTPFARLEQHYRDQPNVMMKNVAVDWETGTRKMYVIEPGHDDHPWVYQLASFRKEVVLHHCETLPALAGWIQEIDLPCLSFVDLVKEAGIDDIGLLQIDTEGFDYDILQMAFDAGHRPMVVHYEHFHLTVEDRVLAKSLLDSFGYSYEKGHMDVLAVRA
jgi:FkbM family methyltransferase